MVRSAVPSLGASEYLHFCSENLHFIAGHLRRSARDRGSSERPAFIIAETPKAGRGSASARLRTIDRVAGPPVQTAGQCRRSQQRV